MTAKETSSKVEASAMKSTTGSDASATPESVTKFVPPYLRLTVPAELAQIKANLEQSLKEIQLENLTELAGQATPGTLTAQPIDIGVAPGKTGVQMASPKLDIRAQPIKLNTGTALSEATPRITTRSRDSIRTEGVVTPVSSVGEPHESPPPIIAELQSLSEFIINDILAMTKHPMPTMKTAQLLTLNPVGSFDMGFWCKATFRARTSIALVPGESTYYYWHLKLSDGTWHELDGGKSTKTRDIDFELDGDTYGLSSYGGNGVAQFWVVCSTYKTGKPTREVHTREYSETVLLHFVNQPCIGIESISMNTVEVTGGNTNNEVTFTINLTAPAPPGGQVFHLSTDSEKAEIHGGGTFYVPQGQKSETLSYFLGAHNVAKDHVIKVIAKMNGHEEYINVKVKKK